MGLFHVAKAVSFLNNDCKLVCPWKSHLPVIQLLQIVTEECTCPSDGASSSRVRAGRGL